MEKVIFSILNDMSECLTIEQMKKLQEILIKRLNSNECNEKENYSNETFLKMFIEAKRVEGCTERTLDYYYVTIEKFLSCISSTLRQMTTEIIREYLIKYQGINNCSKTTIDNVRRNLSSFFTWLESEDYILKSPIRRIHKIKTGSRVKEVLTDENIEILRDGCKNLRDLCIVEFLITTGVRVGELVNLNKDDVNFYEREAIVYGKGNKERKVYFDARAKLHLLEYIKKRKDANNALFVTLDEPHKRLNISGVEIVLRNLGKNTKVERVHPHKFRRSMATKAIDKGMPIEQVQKLLGHQQIDTTMHYAMVNQTNVKNSHRKFIG